MSKLEELIEGLCPDGVEHVALKEVCDDIIVPMRDRPKVFDGNIPWCRIEDKEGQYFNKSLSGLCVSDEVIKKMNLKVFPIGTVICSCSASIGAYAINTQPLITNQTFIGLVCGEKIYNKYLLYFMETQTENLLKLATTGTIPYISRVKFENLIIPIPPLPVQEEIVRILDKFTDLTSELQTELQAELQARAKQYEYYRENLILNSYGETVKLEDIVDIKLGLTATPTYTDSGVIFISAQNTSSDYLDLTNVKYISEDDYEKASSNAKPKKGDILFTRVGSNLGHPVIVETDIDLCMFVSLGYLRVKDFSRTSNIYIKHWMNTELFWEQVRKNVHGAAKVNLNTGWLKDFEVILPSLEKQNEIVGILNNLDILCKDISVDLPAEIEARQKQYEYYRNKLLTFKELQA